MKLCIVYLLIGLYVSCGGDFQESLTGQYANIFVHNSSAEDVIIALNDASTEGSKNDQRVLLRAGTSKVWNLFVGDGTRKVWLKLPSYRVRELNLSPGDHRKFTAGRHGIYDIVRVIFHNLDAESHIVSITPLENGGHLDQNLEWLTDTPKDYEIEGSKYLYLRLTEPEGRFRLSSAYFGNEKIPNYPEVGSGLLNEREIIFKSGTTAQSPYVFYTKLSCTLNLELQKPPDAAKIVYYFYQGGLKKSGESTGATASAQMNMEQYSDKMRFRIKVELYDSLAAASPSSTYHERNIICGPSTPQLNYRFADKDIVAIAS